MFFIFVENLNILFTYLNTFFIKLIKLILFRSNISKSKRSIEPIEEENEQSEEEIETPEKKRKTFVECETWE